MPRDTQILDTQILETPTIDAPTRPLARLIALARARWQAARRAYRLRATIQTLEALDDRTLRDIGLDRGDIVEVVRRRLGAR